MRCMGKKEARPTSVSCSDMSSIDNILVDRDSSKHVALKS